MTKQLDAAVARQIHVETVFWENDPFERPGVDAVENLVNKALDASIFLAIHDEYRPLFAGASRIVEIGGGQGWASCLVKRLHPHAHVTLTDAVPAAVEGRALWERVFNCSLDAAVAAPAQAIPLPDASVDLLFCFAAAHHFVDHAAALEETARLLRPGGTCLWLYEPTSSRLLHAAAEARVNRKRPDVKEHVLVPAGVLRLAEAVGLRGRVAYQPSSLRRGQFEALYYALLSYLPVLARVLPCTSHFVLQKPV
jgi:ubiquinone/menaquinone biosynthesis C-methylase UbiE